jgi:hypothetical protein
VRLIAYQTRQQYNAGAVAATISVVRIGR